MITFALSFTKFNISFMDWLGSAIGATAQHISDIVSFINQKQTNEANLEAVRQTNEANRQLQREANIANMELAKYQNAQNYNLWREQIAEQRSNEQMLRDYNSPLQQMQRLREAGINPNLAYASANTTASSAPTPSAPSMQRATIEASRDIPGHIDPINYGTPGTTVMQAFSLMKDMELRDAQINNLESQAQVNDARSENLYANTVLAGARAAGVKMSTRIAEMMQPFQQSALQANTDLKRRQIDNISSQINNREFMQKVATDRLNIQWRQADIMQRRTMLESARVALTDRLVQLKENRQLFESQNVWVNEQRRLIEQIGVLRQLQNLRPQQLQLQRSSLFINAIKTGFSVGSGIGGFFE